MCITVTRRWLSRFVFRVDRMNGGDEMAEKVRWGVLGVAKIAREKVIPAMQRSRWADVTAIASRDRDKARAAAAAMGIPRAYGSYDELLEDPDVEAIYNPLPNHLHVSWSIRAAERGKHVLCEKPIALTARDALALLSARDRAGVVIQDAFMDIGCYLVNTARMVFRKEPDRVAAAIDRDPAFGIDRLASMLLDFGAAHAIGTCSIRLVPYQRVMIVGTRGRLEIEIPFNAPPDRPCRLFVDDGSDLSGGGIERIEVEACDQYTIQADLFSQAVRGERAPAYLLEDSVRNMAVIDAIFRSADSGRWE